MWCMYIYFGICFDSDLYIFGYWFKLWIGLFIVIVNEIFDYMGEVIDENVIGEYIQYLYKIIGVYYFLVDKLWIVCVIDIVIGEDKIYICIFFWMCQGYYNYVEGYILEWDGMVDFQGEIIYL